MPSYDYSLPKRQLVAQDDAAIIERPSVPRSKFTGAWTRKTTMHAGHLVPFLCEEILPGDHISYDITAYIRMATPLFPLMDNMRIDTHLFFVPNRILWTNWTKFMGEQVNPTDSIAFTIPIITSGAGGFPVNSLFDYFGIPVVGQITAGETIDVNALPLRAYNRIWNDWFRDQNVQNSATVNTGNGPDAVADYAIRGRDKSHDYFTSALPWPQKFTAPTVPVGGQAPVLGLGTVAGSGTDAGVTVFEADSTTTLYANAIRFGAGGGADLMMRLAGVGPGAYPTVYADLSLATGVAINTFRQAFLVQQLMERDARGGTRYTELIKAHFGVTNPDFRLQRPEYIGGGQTPLNVTPIAQTAPTTGVPLGALGGAGTANGQHRASYAATEHGFIIGLISVKSELSYFQGLHKMWTRSTRYDYYWPSLAGLGEQAILRQELYCTGVDADDALVFGYQERWHEYRTRYSEVTGLFRGTSAGNIDEWHLAEIFTAAPTLSYAFLTENPPMGRVLAAGAAADFQHFLCDVLINRTAVRPVPAFGTPVGLGRF